MRRNEEANATYNGIGFLGLLTIAFVVLKLCNVIQWSWLWIFAPLWLPVVSALLIAGGIIAWTFLSGVRRTENDQKN